MSSLLGIMETKEEKRMYQMIEKTSESKKEIVTIENYTCPICKSVNTFWRNDEPGWWECGNCNSTFR